MRRIGRVVFLFFLAWLAAILLGGLGLTPIPRLPLAHTLRPSPGPPQVKLPPPAPTPAADLAPALPASAVATPGVGKIGQARGRSATAPGHATTTGTTTTRGRSATAPGHTRTTTTSTTATTRGRSSTAPGHTKTTTTTTTPKPHKKKP